ncbi:hypothetical protein ZIOFF_028737 [Zingiber officinale]|uniref:Uncharacterized protein n=1 Tax=Zingiber officinale TaxID=94328 RepID=A0A8J5GVJ6_ZINOF|nr:hypothetical protein ZIOFF_028737 [Zingiber officinale]
MASAVVEKKQPVEVEGEMCAPTTQVRGGGGKGLRQYYVQYIHDLQLQIRKKANNLQRLEAQRNDLNSREILAIRKGQIHCNNFSGCLLLYVVVAVRMLREELQLLQKPSSYVGEVVKVMGKSKVLVKASGPMYCYKDGKLTALEEANQPDGIYVHEKCVVWAPQVYFSREITLDDELSHFRDTSSLLSQSDEQLLLRYELQSDQSLLEEYYFPYDSNWLKTQINRGLEFWLGYREASFVSEDEKWKCQFCDFVSDCPFSVTSSRDRIRSR